MTYGAETGTQTKKGVSRLQKVGMKFLWSIKMLTRMNKF